MKTSLTIAALFIIITIAACTKDSTFVGETAPQASTDATSSNQLSNLAGTQARLSGGKYSQSIALDSANRMLASYLNSVGYPAVDTAIRSFSFDADTLRSYLQNSEIVTLKFMVAHKPEYINSGKHGKFAGLKGEALTLVIVGMNNEEQNVLNSRGGVYDHVSTCPDFCPNGVGSPYLY